jgi:hypothetical protein
MKRCLSSGNIDACSTNNPFVVVSKKPRKKKGQFIATTVQPGSNEESSSQLDVSITVVNPSETLSSVNCVDKSLDDLIATVASQKVMIDGLSAQLDFVLSFLGISQPGISSLSSVPARDTTKDTIPLSSKPLYSDIVNNSTHSTHSQQTHRQVSDFHRSVVAAVYVDQGDRDRRGSSFIISGMPTTASTSDSKLAIDLCSFELGVHVDIESTKRLGKTSSPSDIGKIQPILVKLKSADQAKTIISSARRLRQSTVPLIRDNVFINANLTKAEALAAYQIRCRNRDSALRRSQSGVGHPKSSPSQHQSVGLSQLLSSNILDQAAGVLNPSVLPFIPSA